MKKYTKIIKKVSEKLNTKVEEKWVFGFGKNTQKCAAEIVKKCDFWLNRIIRRVSKCGRLRDNRGRAAIGKVLHIGVVKNTYEFGKSFISVMVGYCCK